jgi:hypothetical protein
MDYVSAWERLPQAAERVRAAADASEDEAKHAICRAIADRSVEIQAKLNRHASNGFRASNTILEGKDFEIPTKIEPADLDWENSCPLGQWFVRRGAYDVPGFWFLDWIELSRADVTDILCAGSPPASPLPTKRVTTGRRRPALERAKYAVQEAYPEGVPDQAAEPNACLCRRIGDKLKKQGLPNVSDDTILRAAGRRK